MLGKIKKQKCTSVRDEWLLICDKKKDRTTRKKNWIEKEPVHSYRKCRYFGPLFEFLSSLWLNCVCDTRAYTLFLWIPLCKRLWVCVCQHVTPCHWVWNDADVCKMWLVFVCFKMYILIGYTYSGKSPSTRHIYCFCTWRFRIWCSIWRAFFGLRPNSRRPDVRRSKRWIVRRFFKLNSFASMKTTVLWRYRPHGCT